MLFIVWHKYLDVFLKACNELVFYYYRDVVIMMMFFNMFFYAAALLLRLPLNKKRLLYCNFLFLIFITLLELAVVMYCEIKESRPIVI